MHVHSLHMHLCFWRGCVWSFWQLGQCCCTTRQSGTWHGRREQEEEALMQSIKTHCSPIEVNCSPLISTWGLGSLKLAPIHMVRWTRRTSLSLLFALFHCHMTALLQGFAKWLSQMSSDSWLTRLTSELWTHFWWLALVRLVDSQAWRHAPVEATPYDPLFEVSRVAIRATSSSTHTFKVRSKFKGESWVKWCSRQPFCKTLYLWTSPQFTWWGEPVGPQCHFYLHYSTVTWLHCYLWTHCSSCTTARLWQPQAFR